MTREEKVEIINDAQDDILTLLRAANETPSEKEARSLLQAAANMATIGHFFLADITS